MTKKSLFFNCVWRFGKQGVGSSLFIFYLLAFVPGSQGFPWQLTLAIQRQSRRQEKLDHNVEATGIHREQGLLVEGASPGLPPLSSIPHPPASNGKTGLRCVPSCFPGCFHKWGPHRARHTPELCAEKGRGKGCRGIQGPVPRACPSQHARPFFSCPVLLGWAAAGGPHKIPRYLSPRQSSAVLQLSSPIRGGIPR